MQKMKCREALLLFSILFLYPTTNAAQLAVQCKGSKTAHPLLLNDICLSNIGANKQLKSRENGFGFIASPRALTIIPFSRKEAAQAATTAAATAAAATAAAAAATTTAAQPSNATPRTALRRKRISTRLQTEKKAERRTNKEDYNSLTSGVGIPSAASAATAAAASLAAADAVGAATDPSPAAGAAPAAAAAGAAADDEGALSDFPITRLRTACRKLQLSSKGKREELLQRLHAAAAAEKILSLVQEAETALDLQQTLQITKETAENDIPLKSNTKLNPNKCHKCSRRLSAKARFCSACGATINTVGQETLKEFVEKSFLPVREQEVGSNTMRVERGFWQSILQVIGDVPVANLSSAVWEKYLGVLKRRNCSPRTQVLHQVAYLAALKYAVHTRRLEGIHPFRKIRGCTKRTLVSVPLTAEEVYLLLAATPNTMHCALFAVGIGAGLRPSEILSMRWEDVNMEEMTATIRGSKTAASAAVIPLTNLAARELMRWWEEEGKPTSGLCFYAEGIRTASNRAKLEKKTPIRSFKKALLAAAQRAGIDELRCGEPRRIFPYILRHSFATIAATSNPPVPLPVAQAVMRHTSSKMLLETYAKAGALVIKEGLRNFKI